MSQGTLCQPLPSNIMNACERKVAIWPIMVPSKEGYQVCFTHDQKMRDAYLAKGICGLDPSFRQHLKYTCPEQHEVGSSVVGRGVGDRVLGAALGENGITAAFIMMALIVSLANWFAVKIEEIVKLRTEVEVCRKRNETRKEAKSTGKAAQAAKPPPIDTTAAPRATPTPLTPSTPDSSSD